MALARLGYSTQASLGIPDLIGVFTSGEEPTLQLVEGLIYPAIILVFGLLVPLTHTLFPNAPRKTVLLNDLKFLRQALVTLWLEICAVSLPLVHYLLQAFWITLLLSILRLIGHRFVSCSAQCKP